MATIVATFKPKGETQLKTKILAGLLAGIGLISFNCAAKDATAPAAASQIKNQVLIELKIPDIKFPEGNKPLDCRQFRVRILDVAAGKAVGIHSHENRAGALSIAGGKGMTVYAYNYAPVTVPFGGSYKAYNDIVHYATNSSKTETLSIMTSDFLDDGKSCDGKTYPQHTPIADGLKVEKHPFFVNAPQTKEEDEVDHEYFRTQLRDVKLPDGKAALSERSLRIRRVTLDKGASVGVKDYANRPSYIMNLNGIIDVKNVSANTSKMLKAKEAANLINAGQVEIKNTDSDKATYFVIELWDPSDRDIL